MLVLDHFDLLIELRDWDHLGLELVVGELGIIIRYLLSDSCYVGG